MTSTAARAVVAALFVVLAGCSGLSPEATPSPTAQSTATNPQQNVSTPTPLPNVSASSVKEQALEASTTAATYHVNGSVSRTLQLPTGTVESSVTTVGDINRSARTLYVGETTTGHMQHVEVDTYVQNGTAYQRHVNHETDGNATWYTESVTDEDYRLLDPLSRQALFLENASLTVVNRTTMRGQPVFETYADVDESAYSDLQDRILMGQPMNVTEITFKYYTHRETGQILEMRGILQGTATQGNETVILTEEYSLSFAEYGTPVTVEVPTNATEGR